MVPFGLKQVPYEHRTAKTLHAAYLHGCRWGAVRHCALRERKAEEGAGRVIWRCLIQVLGAFSVDLLMAEGDGSFCGLFIWNT